MTHVGLTIFPDQLLGRHVETVEFHQHSPSGTSSPRYDVPRQLVR
jgi:hypothetical protein